MPRTVESEMSLDKTKRTDQSGSLRSLGICNFPKTANLKIFWWLVVTLDTIVEEKNCCCTVLPLCQETKRTVVQFCTVVVGVQNFQKFVNDSVIPAISVSFERVERLVRPGSNVPRICLETARRWLNHLGLKFQQRKKGMYFDGHERESVVISRKQFLKTVNEDVMPYMGTATVTLPWSRSRRPLKKFGSCTMRVYSRPTMTQVVFGLRRVRCHCARKGTVDPSWSAIF